MRPLSGNSTDPQRPRRVQQVGKDRHELIPGERRVAEQGQPVWVGAAPVSSSAGLFPTRPEVLTPHETAVVQKELVTASGSPRPDGAQKEIAPQAAIQVLDHAAGTHHLPQQLLHGLASPRRTLATTSASTTPARVATCSGRWLGRLSTSRTSSTSVAGTANSSANAWRSPSSVFREGQARRPVDSPADRRTGRMRWGQFRPRACRSSATTPVLTGHSGRRSRGRRTASTSCWSQRTNGATSSARVTACASSASRASPELPLPPTASLRPLPVLGTCPGLAVFQTTACGDGFVGTVLEVTDQGSPRRL